MDLSMITRRRQNAFRLCATIVAVALGMGSTQCSRAQSTPLTLDTFIEEFVAPGCG